MPSLKKISPFFLFLLSYVLVTILLILTLASTPPVSRDALTHHLYVLKLYLLHGSIFEIPEIAFSYYPMLLDLLYMIPLSMGNDIIPKYIHFCFALFTTWLIFDYLQNRLTRTWGLVGALFFLTLPIIVKLSITVYVDLGLIAFSTASLLMLFKWMENKKTRHLIIAGFFCGLAASTKYNGLITIFLLTLFTPLIFSRSTVGTAQHSSFRAIKYGGIFLFCALLAFSPWMLRNYRWTSNPVYPLYNSIAQRIQQKTTNETVFNPELSTNEGKNITQQLTSMGSNVLANRKTLYHETWWQAMLLPIRFFFEGQDDDPRFFDGKLNPLLFFLPFFAFFFYRYNNQVKSEQYFLFAFAWLYFFFAFFQGALRIRYISPSLPAFCILATYGLHNLWIRLQSNHKKKHCRLVIGCILLAFFLYNGIYIVSQFNTIRPLSYLTGKVTRDEFIAHFRNEYPIQQYANMHLKKSSRILAISIGNRGYYFDFPVTFDTMGKNSLLGSLVLSSKTGDEIANKLIDLGFTHLFIRIDLFNKGANMNLTPANIALLNQFLTENTNQIATNTEYTIIEITKNIPRLKQPAI